MVRPKGSVNKNGYSVTPSAHAQRIKAIASRWGKDVKDLPVMKTVIRNLGLGDDAVEELKEAQIDLVKNMGVPVAQLVNEYAFWKTLVNAKMMAGENPTGKEMLSCGKLLLDISKEINRLTEVSADKKVDVFAKTWNGDKDIVIDVSPSDDEKEE